MHLGIEFTLNKIERCIAISASVFIFHKEPLSERKFKDAHDLVHWIIFPEWVESGEFLKPITDYKDINNVSFLCYYTVDKGDDGKYIFTKITKGFNETKTSLLLTGKHVRISSKFDSIIKKEYFDIKELLKSTPPPKEGYTAPRRLKKKKILEEEFE